MANLIKLGGLGPVIVGGPQSIVDQLQSWVTEAGVDGFNLAYTLAPGSMQDFIRLVIPLLQEQGKTWKDYPTTSSVPSWPDGKSPIDYQAGSGFGVDEVLGLTARETIYGVGQRRLKDDHYGSQFKWKAGEEAPVLKKDIDETNGVAKEANGVKKRKTDQ